MLSNFSTFVCAVSFIIFFYQDHVVRLWKNFSTFEEQTILAVGILSSRENFEQRAAARSTWLKEYSSNKNYVKAWFIVGDRSCDIPPDHRLSIYGCEKWNINVSVLDDNFYTSEKKHTVYCSPDSEKKVYQGFSFKVNYPVVVTKLGVYSQVVMKNSDTKVAIMDIQNKEIIVQAVISSDQFKSPGYVYADVDPIFLPKNYEGLVLVEGYLKDTACADIVWNDNGGIVTFKRVYSSHHHLDSKNYSQNFFAAASVMCFVPEIEKLREVASRETLEREKWLLHLEELNKRLRKEMEENNDIVVVDLIDTYRSLPAKLLKFYQWLNLNYKYLYIIKTDDDSVIDVPRLLKKLQTDSEYNPTKLWLWGRFRKDWPVNYIGKWTDYEYQSSHYPSFPCGAAYVMSHQVAHWLTTNADNLYTYQGEDVSIGIWLSAINPQLIEDEDFVCDTTCNFKSYNQAQVGLNQVHKVWSNFKNCNNFCTCTI